MLRLRIRSLSLETSCTSCTYSAGARLLFEGKFWLAHTSLETIKPLQDTNLHKDQFLKGPQVASASYRLHSPPPIFPVQPLLQESSIPSPGASCSSDQAPPIPVFALASPPKYLKPTAPALPSQVSSRRQLRGRPGHLPPAPTPPRPGAAVTVRPRAGGPDTAIGSVSPSVAHRTRGGAETLRWPPHVGSPGHGPRRGSDPFQRARGAAEQQPLCLRPDWDLPQRLRRLPPGRVPAAYRKSARRHSGRGGGTAGEERLAPVHGGHIAAAGSVGVVSCCSPLPDPGSSPARPDAARRVNPVRWGGPDRRRDTVFAEPGP